MPMTFPVSRPASRRAVPRMLWRACRLGGRGLDALTLAGLTLFVLTLSVNIVARIIVSRSGPA